MVGYTERYCAITIVLPRSGALPVNVHRYFGDY